MEKVIKTDTMKTSILDIVTLYYPNFFIQKFPNSLGLGQLIFNFHLKTSAGFFFSFPSNTHSLPFQATARSLIYSKNSPFFLISASSFLWLLVTRLSLSCLSSLQGQTECHGMFVLCPMNLKVPCPANAVVYLWGYHHCFNHALYHCT